MGVIGQAWQRSLETISLVLKQSAELNSRLKAGKVGFGGYVREALAIWKYNLRNFWNPEPDPVHSSAELLARR